MFKVSVMADEKKLSKLLWALDGLIIGPPEVALVKGAGEVDGEVRETDEVSQTSGNERQPPSQRKLGRATKIPGETLPDRVAIKLIKEKPGYINAEVLRKLTVDAGSTENSYSYVVVALRKWGILNGPTAAGLYSVNETAYRKRINIEGSP